jgi:hypothetical protein
MAKTNTAAFAQDPQTFGVVLTSAGASAGTDATLIFTAGAEGSLVSRLSACPQGTVTASGVTIYVEKAGTTVKLAKFSVTVPALTYAATAKLPVLTIAEVGEQTPMRLGAGDKLYAATHVANAAGVAVVGEATDF